MDGTITPNLTHKTTLSSFKTQKFLRECVRKGIEYAVIEASSQALHQFRLWGIPFRVAVITNITHEHLNYHGTMEKYKDSKKALFHNIQTAVLNTADHYFEEFSQLPTPQKIRYGIGRGDLQALDPAYSKYGTHITLHYGSEQAQVELKLPGEFNVENTLAATGAALACGLTISQIAPALQTFESVPGRMERITSQKGFEVIVDFGLTPDALQKLYDTICSTATGRVIGLIGSCGTRDKEKRPVLGRIVAEHCALTIVTDEEPYTEDPMAIMQAVLEGALSTGKRKGIEVELIEDRYQAIEYAVAHAQPGDTIVVTGMGAYTTREMNSGPIPWDEREVVREIISKYTN
ncbi:MAG: UDP-N-acetylmuramyl-tripeptide synthetase, partial [Candidatus Peregrinibacteria bacterium]